MFESEETKIKPVANFEDADLHPVIDNRHVRASRQV